MTEQDRGLGYDTAIFETGESSGAWIDATADFRRAAQARLVVLSGGTQGEAVVVSDAPVVLGRDVSATLQLQGNDVSRRHAIIERSPTGAFLIRDLGSRNGTRVNGVTVKERELAIGDRISIGPTGMLLFTHFNPLDEKMREAQKMEAIGQLAGGVAHDFNNLLNVVLSSLGYLKQMLPTDPIDRADAQAALADAEAASLRGAELARQLLGVARRGKYEPGPLDIESLVDEVARMLRRTFDRSIRVETRTSSQLAVIGDRNQLHQVLMNLCINARDAMPNGGRLLIEAKIVDHAVLLPPELELKGTQPYVMLSVADEGCGMDEETRRRAFQPFFTTKPMGKGTGLGLATVYGIIQNHGGAVEIESAPRRGTTIRAYLPASYQVSGEKAASDDAVTVTERPGRGELVLLVDDEELVRRGMSRILDKSGFRVVLAEDGEEAVEVFRRNRNEIRMVVLDLGMPKMGGEEAFTAMRKLDPRAKVLLMSGYSDDTKVQRMLEAGAAGFLSKPSTMQTFVDTVVRLRGR